MLYIYHPNSSLIPSHQYKFLMLTNLSTHNKGFPRLLVFTLYHKYKFSGAKNSISFKNIPTFLMLIGFLPSMNFVVFTKLSTQIIAFSHS